MSTEAEITEWMDVFLTDNERSMLSERLAIFRELATGASQREISARLGCSVVTVTRGAKTYREHRVIIDRWLAQTTHP